MFRKDFTANGRFVPIWTAITFYLGEWENSTIPIVLLRRIVERRRMKYPS